MLIETGKQKCNCHRSRQGRISLAAKDDGQAKGYASQLLLIDHAPVGIDMIAIPAELSPAEHYHPHCRGLRCPPIVGDHLRHRGGRNRQGRAGAPRGGDASPEEVPGDLEACRQQPLFGSEALSQAQFPFVNISGIPYAGCQSVALGRVAEESTGEE